ncbi:MAG: response regulator transcription factor [Dehalococcoidia bacterium]
MTVFGRDAAQAIDRELHHRTRRVEAPPLLSAREHDVLQGLANGLTHEQIAKTLFLSVSSVDRALQRLLIKANVCSIAALLVKAGRMDLMA